MTRRLRRGAIAFALAAAAAAAGAQTALPATGAQNSFTIYGGARWGGEFEDANASNKSLALDSGGALSASVDWRMADGRQGQVFYSFQRSALPGSAFGQSGDVSVNISYLHLGGRAFFEGTAATAGGYVVGGLGLTWFSPGLSGLSDEFRPSMNIGVGYQWPLAPNMALRAELRGYGTLINSNGSFFCSGGCVVAIRGDSLWQAEGMVGLSIGF